MIPIMTDTPATAALKSNQNPRELKRALGAGFAMAGVVILRKKQPDAERPYRAWGHPVYFALSSYRGKKAV